MVVATYTKDRQVEHRFECAREWLAACGVDVERALERLARVQISLHSWQGDDLVGFEAGEAVGGGGIQAIGQYPGRARTPDELRSDLDHAYRLLPGRHRLNLHSIQGDFARPVDRTQFDIEHYQTWIDWAHEHQLALDFNPTCFAHPRAADNLTLTHFDPAIRQYWIDHCLACRRVAAEIGRRQGSPCVHNVWIPDGYKDTPVDRKTPRERLVEALDEIFAQKVDRAHLLDSVEGKLFGLGLESYTAGSHEFYFGYALTRNIMICLDAGHYHPTESMADKLSSVLLYLPEVLLHVSRGVRWDSDHVVTLTDDLNAVAQEIVRGQFLDRVHIGLDFFDASINRLAAWVIGTRNMLKALLAALLEPIELWRQIELDQDYTARLAWQEEWKLAPVGAVWDYYCLQRNVAPGVAWLEQVRGYERRVLASRG